MVALTRVRNASRPDRSVPTSLARKPRKSVNGSSSRVYSKFIPHIQLWGLYSSLCVESLNHQFANISESRMEHISNKIDGLSEMMKQLSHERSSNSGLATSAPLQPPLHSSLRSSESRVAASDNRTGTRNHHQPLAEAGGIESTLFSHVICATRLLQTVVANDPYSNVAAEMTSVLDALRSTINVQKQQNETLEGSHPFSKALPPGLSSRDLPIPSMDRILACLRIAHGSYALSVA